MSSALLNTSAGSWKTLVKEEEKHIILDFCRSDFWWLYKLVEGNEKTSQT